MSSREHQIKGLTMLIELEALSCAPRERRDRLRLVAAEIALAIAAASQELLGVQVDDQMRGRHGRS